MFGAMRNLIGSLNRAHRVALGNRIGNLEQASGPIAGVITRIGC